MPMSYDLRSDTVTKPTDAMKQAMMQAEVGDDVYGEDPAINALETKVAGILGKEAAIYVPSGTMANQIAINLHTRPGETILAEQDAHIFRYEAGAAAALSGVQFRFVNCEEWDDPDLLARHYLSETTHHPTTTLLAIENTHNYAGGRVFQPELLEKICADAKTVGLRTHCDGARLWNAAAQTGVSEEALARGFDSVAVCFSKGLGAPVGSALVGSQDFIDRARKVRKRFGGAMRQAGSLAAAASYALDHHRSLLGDDHRRAGGLAELLRAHGHWEVKCPNPCTNMVYFRHKKRSADELVQTFKEGGILLNHLGQGWLRAVFHFQVDDGVIEAFDKQLKALG